MAVCTQNWILAANLGSRAALGTIPGRAWLFPAVSGMATSHSRNLRALHLGQAARVAPVDKPRAVFVIILAAIFLHEHVGWGQWVGGGLTVSGAVVMARFS